MADTKLLTISGKCLHLLTSDGVVDAFLLVARCVVVGHRIDVVRPESLDAFVAKRVKSLRTCHFVSIKPVNIKLCRAVLYVLNYMGVPDFVK